MVEALKSLTGVHSVTMTIEESWSTDDIVFPPDDQAYTLAVECLQRAGTRIANLYVELDSGATIDSQVLCTSHCWQAWDLGALHSLRIESFRPPEPNAGGEPGLRPILSKCSRLLTELRLEYCDDLFGQPLDLSETGTCSCERKGISPTGFLAYISFRTLKLRRASVEPRAILGFGH